MFNVYKNVEMTKEGYLFGIEAEKESHACAPGQFFEIGIPGDDHLVPAILTDILPDRGIIKVVFSPINETTKAMAGFPGDSPVEKVEGPFGKKCPFLEENVEGRKFLVISEELGGAAAYMMIHDLKKKGAVVDAVAGGRKAGYLYLSEFTGELCRNYWNYSEDGSQGEKGTITDNLDRILAADTYDECVVIGSVALEEVVAKKTGEKGIKTWVSLDPTVTALEGYRKLDHVTVNGVTKSIKEDGTMFSSEGIDFSDLYNQLK